MRIEPSQRDAAAGVAVEAGQRVGDAGRRDGVERLAERTMDGEQSHLQIGGEESHQIVAAVAIEAARRRQIVGVAAEVGQLVAGDRLFRNRRGDQRVDHSSARQRDSDIERTQGAARVGGTGTAEGNRPTLGHRIEDRHLARPQRRQPRAGRQVVEIHQALPGRVGNHAAQRGERGALDHHQRHVAGGRLAQQQLDQDLGADPRGIALGEREDGSRHALGYSVSPPPWSGRPARRALRRSSSSLNM